jgi:N-acetylmuramoyl-L-alanine amidase
MTRFIIGSIFIAIALIASGCATTSPRAYVEPKIMSVQQWGGTATDDPRARKHAISHITLHHQGETFKPGRDPQQYLRDLQTWSRKTRLWIDIPYHYIIDLDGNIYEGRDINFAGDTNTQYDPAGHALIEVVGNFEEVEPNQQQLDAVVNAMTMLAIKYKVPLEKISGHKDVASGTVCPGKNLYRYLENGYFRDAVTAKLKVAAE